MMEKKSANSIALLATNSESDMRIGARFVAVTEVS